MTEVSVGNGIYELRKQIQQIQSELKAMGNAPQPMPELVEYANLLRSNEFYEISDAKKTELLSVYAQYSKALEKLLSNVFDIQNDLKNILKEQSKLLEKSKKRSKTSKKSKK